MWVPDEMPSFDWLVVGTKYIIYVNVGDKN